MRSGSPSLHRGSSSKRGKHRPKATFYPQKFIDFKKARCGEDIVSVLLQRVSLHCGEGDPQPKHPIQSCDVAAAEEGQRRLPCRAPSSETVKALSGEECSSSVGHWVAVLHPRLRLGRQALVLGKIKGKQLSIPNNKASPSTNIFVWPFGELGLYLMMFKSN